MRITDPDAVPVPQTPTLPASAEIVIEALAPLVTDARLARIQAVVGRRTRAVVPVLEQLIDPYNISAVLRSSDAFGLQRLEVIEGERGFRAARRVSKGAQRWLDINRHPSSEACIASLHDEGYDVLVASMDGTCRPEALRDRERVALVFGNEHRGVSEAAHSMADGSFAVPMAGFVESLNVSVAAALSLYAARGDRPGDLDERDRSTLVARFLMNSVRDASRIVLEHEKSR